MFKLWALHPACRAYKHDEMIEEEVHVGFSYIDEHGRQPNI